MRPGRPGPGRIETLLVVIEPINVRVPVTDDRLLADDAMADAGGAPDRPRERRRRWGGHAGTGLPIVWPLYPTVIVGADFVRASVVARQ